MDDQDPVPIVDDIDEWKEKFKGKSPPDPETEAPVDETEAPKDETKEPVKETAPKAPVAIPPAQSPRAWAVKRHGRSEVMQPRSVLVLIADYCKRGEGLSRGERTMLGKILDSMIDRICEMQRAYDVSITRNEEFDPEKHPHRMHNGTGVFVRWDIKSDQELNWCLGNFIGRPTPFPAALVLRNAEKDAEITEVMYPRMDFSNGVAGGLFSAILRIGRKTSVLDTTDGPVDSPEAPINDGGDVLSRKDQVGVLPVDVGTDPEDKNLAQVPG